MEEVKKLSQIVDKFFSEFLGVAFHPWKAMQSSGRFFGNVKLTIHQKMIALEDHNIYLFRQEKRFRISRRIALAKTFQHFIATLNILKVLTMAMPSVASLSRLVLSLAGSINWNKNK